MDYIITFNTTHHALKAEKVLKTGNFALDLIPTPRAISSECGFTVLVRNNKSSTLVHFIKKLNLSYNKIYKTFDHNGEEKYEEIS